MSLGTAYVTTYLGEFYVMLVISTSDYCFSTVVRSSHLPLSRATTEILRAATMFSLLKDFVTYDAVIAMKFCYY